MIEGYIPTPGNYSLQLYLPFSLMEDTKLEYHQLSWRQIKYILNPEYRNSINNPIQNFTTINKTPRLLYFYIDYLHDIKVPVRNP